MRCYYETPIQWNASCLPTSTYFWESSESNYPEQKIVKENKNIGIKTIYHLDDKDNNKY